MLINLFNARLVPLETENQSLRERVAHLEEQFGVFCITPRKGIFQIEMIESHPSGICIN
jgi:hypothetical protein